jgi:hypothetical protein
MNDLPKPMVEVDFEFPAKGGGKSMNRNAALAHS